MTSQASQQPVPPPRIDGLHSLRVDDDADPLALSRRTGAAAKAPEDIVAAAPNFSDVLDDLDGDEKPR